VDFYPTLLEIAGLSPRPQQALDGVSFVPLLHGQPMAPRPIFWHYPHYSNQGGPPVGAVMAGDFKLVEWYEDMRCELYNVCTDAAEQHDLASQMPDKVNALRDELHRWRQSVGAQMPTPNPHYDPAAAPRNGGAKRPRQGAARAPGSSEESVANVVPLDFQDD
jgi:arylsulfatase A-like enzyme